MWSPARMRLMQINGRTVRADERATIDVDEQERPP
jgi:hypothetical protein